MPTGRKVAIVALWLLSLVAASRWGTAEAQSMPQRGPRGEEILTGNDVGFMLFPATSGQTRPAGAIVIRQKGQWIVPEMGRPVSPDSSQGRIVPLR